jgi:hypothetical protein
VTGWRERGLCVCVCIGVWVGVGGWGEGGGSVGFFLTALSGVCGREFMGK